MAVLPPHTKHQVLLLLGKLVVTIVCGFFTYLLLNNMSTFQAGGDSELTSTWLSVLVWRHPSYHLLVSRARH